jgi:nitronate monooxygenase
VQGAPLGGLPPTLAPAITLAGALGTLACAGLEPAAVARDWPQPIAANFQLHRLDKDRATLEEMAPRVRVLDFFWGDPDPALVALAHEAGAVASWQCGSAEEAAAAEAAGCDFVIAQGIEAGGHVRATEPLERVLAATLERVSVPVLAAGGIATAAHLRRVLEAGADGARVGTAFLAAEESGAHPDYVAALLEESETEYTSAFHVGWEDAPHRVLTSALRRAAEAPEVVGEKAGRPVPRWASSTPDTATSGDVRAMSLWAGTGVGSLDRVMPAAEIVATLDIVE